MKKVLEYSISLLAPRRVASFGANHYILTACLLACFTNWNRHPRRVQIQCYNKFK